jgi:hypothetical protein
MSINGSRGLATAVTDELAKDKITYVDLIELHFDSADGGVQRLTNGQFSISATTTTSSGTYTANGKFLTFESVNETNEARVNEINIILDGVSSTFTNLFLNNNYVERRVVIYRQFLAEDGTAISTPVMMFDGEIKNFTVNDQLDTSTVVVKSASVFYNFSDLNGRRSTSSSQQREFSQDRGFDFASTATKDIRWGRENL